MAGARRGDPWALVNVLVISGVVILVLMVWVLSDLGGWQYYTTPLRIRGYAPQHKVLRPTGSVAHALGGIGLLMLTMPVLYSVRKKWKRLANLGSMKNWLEVHIFCGVVGPALVTVHTSLKFNGIVSVAYWSMAIVVLSGFVGRYWYVRIPKSIRGAELTHDEIRARAEELKAELAATTTQAGLRDLIHAVEQALEPSAAGAPPGHFRVRRYLRRLRRDLQSAGADRRLIQLVSDTLAERVLLVRRLAYLNRTKKLFAMWHVFHLPLVYVMFGIAVLHVGVALYLGYALW